MRNYYSGNYKESLERLEDSAIKGRDSDKLLYLLEKATILNKSGDVKKAQKLYIEADKLSDELYTISISKTVSSFLYNSGIFLDSL